VESWPLLRLGSLAVGRLGNFARPPWDVLSDMFARSDVAPRRNPPPGRFDPVLATDCATRSEKIC
jgi:hypothetical protein